MSAAACLIRRLRPSQSGVAMTEFALAAPLLMLAGLYGAETAWLTITHMRVNQVTQEIADDASRIGEISALETRKIYESDVNDLLYGAHLETDSLNFFANGRVIISSLEVVPDSDPDRQYIHWQRCKGRLNWASNYGNEGDGLTGTSFTGMGPTGDKVTALEDDAVMFVEVAYNYQPLFGSMFVSNRLITSYAAFNVRDTRDLAQIYQRNVSNPDPVSGCTTFSDFSGNTTVVAPAGTYTPPSGGGGSTSTSSTSTSSSGGSSGGSSSGGGSSGGASSGGASSGGASSGGASSGGASSGGASSGGGPGV
ncbi:TadE/TadG family type IV pilus assembly protein [Parerythrobacter aurantius]|uniref:hypothetical protein n=1 Tax=Parerythrobacter aurantius TaxID=3127706 RepID=UPI00325421B1